MIELSNVFMVLIVTQTLKHNQKLFHNTTMEDRNTSSGEDETYEMWKSKNAANQVCTTSPSLLKKTVNGN